MTKRLARRAVLSGGLAGGLALAGVGGGVAWADGPGGLSMN